MAGVDKQYWEKSLGELQKGWKQLQKKTAEIGKQVQSGKAWQITKKKLAEAGEFIGKQAKAGTKLGRLKLNEFTLNQDKNRLLAEIGKKTVQSYKRGKITDPDLKEMCKKLAPLDKDLRQVKREISNLAKSQKS